jgi:hypothetical protein
MSNPLVTNFAFWAGAASGALMMASHEISNFLGFTLPVSLVFPVATFCIFGRPFLKACQFESKLSDDKHEPKWGRPEKGKTHE